MHYIQPELVISPKGMVSDLNILINTGEEGWALARLKWDGDPSIAIRWNGGSKDNRFPGIGNPQSRGVPTWFILPSEIGEVIVEKMIVHVKIYLEKDLPETLALTGILRIEQATLVDCNDKEYDNQSLVDNTEFRSEKQLTSYVAKKLGISPSIVEIVE